MTLTELLLISVGLSMDAFAAAICEGLCMRRKRKKNALIIGLLFGGFQGIMPFIGYTLGKQFSERISAVDHWVAFVLLGLIGINMIKESRDKSMDEKLNCNIEGYESRIGDILLLAIATSIDALAVGITFAFLNVNIGPAISMIGIITFIIAILGVKIGTLFGTKFKSKAEFIGGSILILIGIDILFEHLNILL